MAYTEQEETEYHETSMEVLRDFPRSEDESKSTILHPETTSLRERG